MFAESDELFKAECVIRGAPFWLDGEPQQPFVGLQWLLRWSHADADAGRIGRIAATCRAYVETFGFQPGHVRGSSRSIQAQKRLRSAFQAACEDDAFGGEDGFLER